MSELSRNMTTKEWANWHGFFAAKAVRDKQRESKREATEKMQKRMKRRGH
ncbi:MAG: hypothetical protein ABIH46_06865 [Chloroflexota bacterium]